MRQAMRAWGLRAAVLARRRDRVLHMLALKRQEWEADTSLASSCLWAWARTVLVEQLERYTAEHAKVRRTAAGRAVFRLGRAGARLAAGHEARRLSMAFRGWRSCVHWAKEQRDLLGRCRALYTWRRAAQAPVAAPTAAVGTPSSPSAAWASGDSVPEGVAEGPAAAHARPQTPVSTAPLGLDSPPSSSRSVVAELHGSVQAMIAELHRLPALGTIECSSTAAAEDPGGGTTDASNGSQANANAQDELSQTGPSLPLPASEPQRCAAARRAREASTAAARDEKSNAAQTALEPMSFPGSALLRRLAGPRLGLHTQLTSDDSDNE